MSLDLALVNEVTQEVSTYSLSGTEGSFELTSGWVVVPSSLRDNFQHVLGDEGILSLIGVSGEDSIPLLESLLYELDIVGEYQDDPEGIDVGKAIEKMIYLANYFPDEVWSAS